MRICLGALAVVLLGACGEVESVDRNFSGEMEYNLRAILGGDPQQEAEVLREDGAVLKLLRGKELYIDQAILIGKNEVEGFSKKLQVRIIPDNSTLSFNWGPPPCDFGHAKADERILVDAKSGIVKRNKVLCTRPNGSGTWVIAD